ncbi:MAG: hypothetical protein EBV03_09430 [Proteobacteria bacterium]|nr:hypothetical protein [Pseudomonadota bacterium]
MKNSAQLLYGFVLLVGDFVALVAAFTLAYIIRVKLDIRPLIEQVPAQTYLYLFLSLLPFWLLIFALLNLYKKEVYENRFSEAARIVVGCVIGLLFLLSSEYVFNRVIFPARLVPVYGFLMSMLLVLLYKVVGVVGNAAHLPKVPKTKVFATFSQAIEALKKVGIHSIVQSELYAEQTKNEELSSYAQDNHMGYKFVPGNSDVFVGKIDVELLQNIPVVSVHSTALVGWGRVAKRLFDIVISMLLLVVLSPLFLLIALYLYLFDHGDVIFKQSRLTRFNTSFNIYKFRTIKHTYNNMLPEEGFAKMGKPQLAKKYRENGDFLPRDPRFGHFGSFLRKTSLDELPQLLNILKGDISLVGPRALVHRELDNYAYKNLILSVKSGLTGLAQISGRKDIPFEERRRLDLYYVQNWSFWLDITIIAKTAVQVVGRVFNGKAD